MTPDTAPPGLAATTYRRLRRHMSPSLALAGKFAGQGAVEVRGQGCRVRLSDGRDVLDFGSYAVTLLGHRHPAVVDAVRRQLDEMPVATRSLGNPLTAAAAEELAGYLGSPLDRVYFGTGGAEVVEAAVKLARLVTGRRTVVAVEGAYHGKTLGALALTHQERFRTGLEGLLGGVVHVDPADAAAVGRVAREGDLAAVVFEPVQGEHGVVPLREDVLAAWCADARAAGAFTVADEIQVGLRRTGERSAALGSGLEVDAVLLGKALGGGVMPVAAAVCTDRLYQPLLDDPFLHTSTFGGQPLAMAAVPAALRAVEDHAENGALIAESIGRGLVGLCADFPDVLTEVRGRGLIWGLDFTSPEHAGEVIVALARHGLLVSPCLSRPRTLRLLPPLVATEDDVRAALEMLAAALSEARSALEGVRPREAVR
ncbi:aspartate aminotransferase family protein [Nocardiopsis aegyptia]|uniref:Putrescine aminotransferase n=1 Tax=Nocardiopsis aegyptia TaxID=220378 RepID=A0A7Z0EP97_9ACTN|nr:aspartate aminotransferase family protein [Nocardiopsis aegyptia]NYJ35782.1 putrescine aminotransferase [Nocardiopsis aegyptia]